MNSIQAKAELILGLGEFLKIDVTEALNQVEATLKEIPSGSYVEQLSTSSITLQSDQPFNTNILGGTSQTNVRLLVLIAETA
jgi:hypothetical protein